MARALRVEYAGAVYHVTSRGNARQDIVRDDVDRQKWVDWVRRTVETYHWRLHAWVLMGNHDHLFVETPEPNLSAGMQYFNGSYTSYFNRRHRCCGHLFQGRYQGHLIEEQGYFLEVSRYLHLNPVRAKIVSRPEEYPWSGVRRGTGALTDIRHLAPPYRVHQFGEDTSNGIDRHRPHAIMSETAIYSSDNNHP